MIDHDRATPRSPAKIWRRQFFLLIAAWFIATILYPVERVTRIIILEENESSQYNYVRQESESRFERAVALLAF